MTDDPAVLLARLEYISQALPFAVTTRPMMGGHIGYADGRPFVSLSTGGFGIKLLPPDQERLLARPGARRQRHGPGDPPSRSYVARGPDDLDDDEVLAEWLVLAARTAPERRPSRRRG